MLLGVRTHPPLAILRATHPSVFLFSQMLAPLVEKEKLTPTAVVQLAAAGATSGVAWSIVAAACAGVTAEAGFDALFQAGVSLLLPWQAFALRKAVAGLGGADGPAAPIEAARNLCSSAARKQDEEMLSALEEVPEAVRASRDFVASVLAQICAIPVTMMQDIPGAVAKHARFLKAAVESARAADRASVQFCLHATMAMAVGDEMADDTTAPAVLGALISNDVITLDEARAWHGSAPPLGLGGAWFETAKQRCEATLASG